MPRRPPRCPDCSSTKARPIIYGEPDERLGRRAELGEVVLGGCCITDEDPAWDCPDCRKRFGNSAKPYKKLPDRSRDEWIELIKTMLPAPVHVSADGDLLASDPVVVIVRVETDAIRIMEAGIEWQDAHAPTLKGQPFAKVPLGASSARVAELIAKAWGKRISQYRWCPRCRRRIEPEHMDALCHGCAEKHLGVVF